MRRRGTVERVTGRAHPIERLSAEDQLLLWPDEAWPQDLGAIALLDGATLVDPDGRFRIETVRAVVESQLHLVPRFRQMLVTPRRGLGPPLWEDATAFDVAEHVRVLPLPAPGDEAQLLAAVERLRRRRLDRTRPLWEMWFLTGLAGNRVFSTPTPRLRRRPRLRGRGARRARGRPGSSSPTPGHRCPGWTGGWGRAAASPWSARTSAPSGPPRTPTARR
ncbi:hypothetical protein KZX45_00280 [Georgenia sp. EYE_87]|uniref:wax ester/triacylglycerol synthase domain-containing protein n=1 Tax=Georgenia sp. EYE_87 TaxID=2853448 RepID=UPI0020048716|nr:wax ester/triacylglycerol synthase domain-containing protein [Georgenia sp. EYE_87]MCK6208979.1 hypothetical protein [Georgenia sp. EYE_87]